MKPSLEFIGKVIITIMLINIIGGFVPQLKSIINDPLGTFGIGKK